MSESINVARAKAELSSLLDRAARGEEIVIARAGKPLARLAPLEERPKRVFGAMRERWPDIADDVLLSPMSREELRWAEGYYQNEEGLYSGRRSPAKRAKRAKDKPRSRKPVRKR